MLVGAMIAVEMTGVDGLTGTIAVGDLSEMTADSNAETNEVEVSTETIAATTAATGNVQSAITTISLSDKNVIAAENREEVIVTLSVQTTEVSNAASNGVEVSSEMTVPATVCKATGIARSVTMTTLLGELNATNVAHLSLEVKDDLHDGMTEEATTDMEETIGVGATEEVAMTDAVATEEVTTVEAAVKYSTTMTGSALSATIQILHSDMNATDVVYREMVANLSLVAMTDVVATEEVAMTDAVVTGAVATEEAAMTDVVATEGVAMTDVVATEGVAMTDVVATEEVAMTDDLPVVNLVNSERPVVKAQAMLTTDLLAT